MNKKLIFSLLAVLIASVVIGLTNVSAYHYDYGYQPYGYNSYHSSYSKETHCSYHGCTTEVSKNDPYGSTYYRTSNNYGRYYPSPHYQTYRINPGYGSYGYLYEPTYRNYYYSPYSNAAYRYWSWGY